MIKESNASCNTKFTSRACIDLKFSEAIPLLKYCKNKVSYSGEQLTKRNRDTPAFPPRKFFLYLLFATFNLRTQFVQNLLCSLAYQSSPSLLVNRAGAAIIDKEGSEGGGAVVKHVLRRSVGLEGRGDCGPQHSSNY